MEYDYLENVLHAVSQALTIPIIIVLLAGIAYALFSIGSLLVELFVERRHFKVALPEFLRAMDDASVASMPSVIEESGLLVRQKSALMTIFDNRDLPEEARWALAKRVMASEEDHFGKVLGRNETVAKIAPMVGLMGTLVPLGPGVVALGQGDTAMLSSSLLIAFDTTVAGLVVAAICLVIAKIRRTWYTNYSTALEASVTTMLEKIDLLHKNGEVDVATPVVASEPASTDEGIVVDWAALQPEQPMVASVPSEQSETPNGAAVAAMAGAVADAYGGGVVYEPSPSPAYQGFMQPVYATDVAQQPAPAEGVPQMWGEGVQPQYGIQGAAPMPQPMHDWNQSLGSVNRGLDQVPNRAMPPFQSEEVAL